MKTTEKKASSFIQWHPAFLEALKHDLSPYKDVLTFEDDHELTAAPLKIDLIVIKKEKGAVLKKKIAAFFLAYNIFEYKSPDDYLSINDFYKAFAYFYLYKSLENIDINDMTLTFSVSRYPKKVMDHLQNIRKSKITKQHSGIYYVTGDAMPIQFIVNSELDTDENLFLNSLTKSMSINKSSLLLNRIKEISKEEQSQITAFIDAVMRGNIKIFTEVIKMEDFKAMAESIRDTDFAKFWQNEGMEKGMEKGIEKGIERGMESVLELLDDSQREKIKQKLYNKKG